MGFLCVKLKISMPVSMQILLLPVVRRMRQSQLVIRFEDWSNHHCVWHFRFNTSVQILASLPADLSWTAVFNQLAPGNSSGITLYSQCKVASGLSTSVAARLNERTTS
jgi:hypothetical protein